MNERELEREEKKLELEIKKAAKMGNKQVLKNIRETMCIQGGITCGAIEDPRKSSKAIDERVIINFRDKNVVIARSRDKNVYR